MKTFRPCLFLRSSRVLFLVLAVLVCLPTARAGLTVDIHLYHDEYGYYFYPWLYTNATPPAVSEGTYRIQSPQQPANGSWLLYEAIGGSFNHLDGNPTRQYDFDSHLDALTNGLWSIWVTNSTTTNEFKFAVTVSGFTSNTFGGPALVLFPEQGELNVPNQPTFLWSGPANWAGSLNVVDYFIDEFGDYSFQTDASLPPGNTSWFYPLVLPEGTNEFTVSYHSNATSIIVASIPTNSAGQAIAGWISTATLDTSDTSTFVVVANNAFDQFLVGRYNFENTNSPGLDSSGNGNHSNCSSSSGPQEDIPSTDAASGQFSREFFGDTSICFTPTAPGFHGLSNALADDFTVTAWVKTSDAFGSDSDSAVLGAGVFFPYSASTSSVAPLSITGSKAAFTITSASGVPTTLHSTTSVNDSTFHFIAVTRNRTTGAVKLYVDGNLEDSATGPTVRIFCSSLTYIGGGWFQNYIGLVDDVRIYSTELSAQDVASLFGSGAGGSGIIAHYDFDDFDSSGSYPQDVSGNGNHMDYGSGFNSGGYDPNVESIAGPASVEFYKDSGNSNSGGMLGWNPMPAGLLNTLAGSFTISIWVKTSNETGTPGQNAADGACIVVADVPGSARDLTPIALTGGHVAFTTGGDEGDDTLTSDTYVSDDSWHHIVVTRHQQTGEKRLYIDGQEDIGGPTTGSTDLLDDPNFLSIGVRMDASASDPDSAGRYSATGYEGLLDDLQIYNRVITIQEVAFLYENPGQYLAGGSSPPTLANAVDNDLFTFTTGGDAPWLYQTNVTHDSEDTAESGTIGDNQASWFETVAPVGGEISFWWKVSSAFGDYVGFFINGVQWDNIWGDEDWRPSSHYVNAGDVLRWEYYKNGFGSEGDDKAWVDQVTFTPDLDVPALGLHLELVRDQVLNLGERFFSLPFVTWPSTPPITTNRLSSPNGLFTSTKTPSTGSTSAIYVSSLQALLNECTNGVWTIYINKGHPFEQIYTFSVTITNLDTNLLARVHILSPTNGLSNVPTNSTFHWTGPTGFESVRVKKFMPPNGANEVSTLLPGTATTWPSPPALIPGINDFNVRYESNNFPHVIFTVPVDGLLQPLASWTTSTKLISAATVEFEVVATAPPQPAQITGVQRIGGNFQFQFQSEIGRTNTVQSRTNLVLGNWLDRTNIPGDGTLKTIQLPIGNLPTEFFRVATQ